MSLKDLFGPAHPKLGSGVDALIDEVEEEQRREDEQNNQNNDMGDLGRNDIPIDNSGVIIPSERYLDRMIRIKGWVSEKEAGKSTLMWDDPDFLEILELNNLNEKDQKKFIRRYLDLAAISSGDGNSGMTGERARVLAVRMLSQRSRSDLGNDLNERGAWIETRNSTKQSIRTTQGGNNNGKSSGFLSRLFGH
jgi:hypothetical protein